MPRKLTLKSKKQYFEKYYKYYLHIHHTSLTIGMFQIMSDYIMSLFKQRIFYKQCDLERKNSNDNINTLAISEEIMENGIRRFYAIDLQFHKLYPQLCQPKHYYEV